MSGTIEECLEFVNDQAKFHADRAKQYAGSPRAIKHSETRAKFLELKEFILSLSSVSDEKEPAAKFPTRQLRLTLSPQEIDGLPDELIEELSISKTDKVEYAILNTLEELGGAASLDQLIVYIFRETGEIQKRTTLTNRLYRMAGKAVVHSVPDKKGVYSLQPLQPGQLDEMIEKSKTKSERSKSCHILSLVILHRRRLMMSY